LKIKVLPSFRTPEHQNPESAADFHNRATTLNQSLAPWREFQVFTLP
jgi:hypothetical protein